MPAEILVQQPDHHSSEEKTLEELLLDILKKHDGFCLDNERERASLARVLATAFMAQDPLHQTTDSSVSPPPSE